MNEGVREVMSEQDMRKHSHDLGRVRTCSLLIENISIIFLLRIKYLNNIP